MHTSSILFSYRFDSIAGQFTYDDIACDFWKAFPSPIGSRGRVPVGRKVLTNNALRQAAISVPAQQI
jgi:hypothetical protein